MADRIVTKLSAIPKPATLKEAAKTELRVRCVQLGLSMSDLDMLSIGLINDMYVESRNDDCNYAALATQEE